MKNIAKFPLFVAGLVLMSFALMGCGADQDKLVVYSGRSKALVEPLVEQFQEQADIQVDVRYGRGAQLLAALQEEGAQSPADVFWANTAGALGAARNADLLSELPSGILEQPGRFVPSSGRWVPITSRFRVIAYHTERVSSDELPASVLDLPELEQFEGRIGWTPTYSSFQDFVTAMRLKHGPDTTRTWLNNMQDLNPESYRSNTPMIQALMAGEIDMALTNHYYVYRFKHGGAEGEYEGHEEEEHEEEEEGGTKPQAPITAGHFEDGDVGNLALVTGAGLLQTSDQPEQARQFLEFLLSQQAQEFAAEQVHEYPVVPGVTVPDYMRSIEAALNSSPDLDFEQLRNMDATLTLMREVGLL